MLVTGAVDMHRLGNVLHGLRAEVVEARIKLAPDLFVNAARHADTARVGQSLDAGRHVDAIAIKIASLDDDVAEVDADAEHDAAGFRQAGVDLGKAFLHLDRALHSVDRAGKFDQHAIAHHFDDSAMMLRDLRNNHLAMPRLESR